MDVYLKHNNDLFCYVLLDICKILTYMKGHIVSLETKAYGIWKHSFIRIGPLLELQELIASAMFRVIPPIFIWDTCQLKYWHCNWRWSWNRYDAMLMLFIVVFINLAAGVFYIKLIWSSENHFLNKVFETISNIAQVRECQKYCRLYNSLLLLCFLF